MMRVLIMNSSNMPHQGAYLSEIISKEEFTSLLHKHKQQLVSGIGYQSVVDLIHDMTGIKLEVSREKNEVEDGDLILFMKLPFRIKDPNDKGRKHYTEEDYIFGKTYYYEHQQSTGTNNN